MDCFGFAGKDGHEPLRELQRPPMEGEGLIPSNAAVSHWGLTNGVTLAIWSGDQNIKTSGCAIRWNGQVHASDDYMDDCEKWATER